MLSAAAVVQEFKFYVPWWCKNLLPPSAQQPDVHTCIFMGTL